MKTITTEQMELGMNGTPAIRLTWHRRERSPRAQWWFTKMRQIVDMAMPAKQENYVRPEQTYFELSRGTAK